MLYHLLKKRVVPVEKQMKRSTFSGTCNCGQMVQKFPGIPVKARKREYMYLERYYLFSERDEPFHLNSPRNRSFARQPCCMAGTMKMFCIRKNIFSQRKKNPCNMAAVQNLCYRKFHSNGKRFKATGPTGTPANFV